MDKLRIVQYLLKKLYPNRVVEVTTQKMAGSLFHSREFRHESHIGFSGATYVEVMPVDGDIEVVSLSSWHDAKLALQRIGVKAEDIPEYSRNSEVVLEDLAKKCERVRTVVRATSPRFTPDSWEERLVGYLLHGEDFYFVIE